MDKSLFINDDNDEDLGDDDGNGNYYNDVDSIHSSLDGNPSHLIDNDFFYRPGPN